MTFKIHANLVSLISIAADAVDPWMSKYYMEYVFDNNKERGKGGGRVKM